MTRSTRRQALATLAAPLLAAAEARPNFVIISIDDLGYADVSPFGSGIDYTPNIDRMAREGMRLNCCYAQPVCTPSRAALLTGCYPRRVGLEAGSWHGVLFPGDRHGLNPREITIARLLKKQGYATACVGKWHLGDQPEFLPTRHGFDSYFGIPYSNDMGRGVKNPRARNPCPPLPLVRNEKAVREVTDQDVLTPEYTAEAVRFIKQNRRRPFFLYLPHNQVHGPLFAAKPMRGKTGKGLYADAVADSDASVGEVLRAIETEGLAKNTLVIFTSDNGGTPRAVNKPLRGNKGSVFEGGLRTPTIAWWPGRIAPGSRSDALTSHIDFLPTLAKLAGTAPPADRKIDGHDLFPLLSGQTAQSPWDAFYFYQARNLRAVRSGPWKYHVNGELYNLDEDIAESRNVASAAPDVVKRMKDLIAAGLADLGEGDAPGPGCRPVGKAKGPLRFFLPHDPSTGLAPHAPVNDVG